MVACRCPVVSHHPHKKTSNTSKLPFFMLFLLHILSNNFMKIYFFRYGGQSCKELWGVVMITMDAGTSSSFQQSCTKWLELSSLKITGMEQLPCLIVIPGSSWSHSGMKTWYTIFNVLLIWNKKLNFFFLYLIIELWCWFQATEQSTYNAVA